MVTDDETGVYERLDPASNVQKLNFYLKGDEKIKVFKQVRDIYQFKFYS